MSRNPACATEEYASRRLTSFWVTPTTVPTIIVSAAITQSTGAQSSSRRGTAVWKNRRIAPNAASLVPAAMNAVIEVGAPW